MTCLATYCIGYYVISFIYYTDLSLITPSITSKVIKTVGTQTDISWLQQSKNQQTWTVDAHQEYASMLKAIELDHTYYAYNLAIPSQMDLVDGNEMNTSFYSQTESMDTEDNDDIIDSEEEFQKQHGTQRKFIENGLDC